MVKLSIGDLAIFGGRPAFAETLHVGRPNIGDRDVLFARIDEILDRNWLTNNGPSVQALERRIEAMLGVKHCIAVANATIGLQVCVEALGLTGEVITPSFTFAATAHALKWQGLSPVFCDIDPETYTLDPAAVERQVTARTSGILGVHVWGRVCDIDGLNEVAGRHGLAVFYDAAHAFGCSHGGRMVGGFGAAEVFSFHATKMINSFEGGAITTDDGDLAARMRTIINFGFVGADQVAALGINGKMSEVSAAMGLTSLDSFDDFVATNRRNYHAYRDGLAAVPGVEVVPFDRNERCTYPYVAVIVDPAPSGISRDNLVEVLTAEGVRARRYFYPGCHEMEPYRTEKPDAGKDLPATERVTGQVLCLPTGTAVGPEEIAEICALIGFSAAHGHEIDDRLHAAMPTPRPASGAS